MKTEFRNIDLGFFNDTQVYVIEERTWGATETHGQGLIGYGKIQPFAIIFRNKRHTHILSPDGETVEVSLLIEKLPELESLLPQSTTSTPRQKAT